MISTSSTESERNFSGAGYIAKEMMLSSLQLSITKAKEEDFIYHHFMYFLIYKLHLNFAIQLKTYIIWVTSRLLFGSVGQVM